MDVLGTLHLGSALVALVSGGMVVLLRKATALHRRIGWVYVAAMVTLNATALMIYDLFGGFGPFHAAALASGLTILVGMRAAWTRTPKRFWILTHAWWMAGSYVGLWAAAVSETATRYLTLPFGATVMAATGLVAAIGGLAMARGVPRALRGVGFGRS